MEEILRLSKLLEEFGSAAEDHCAKKPEFKRPL